MLRHPQVWIMSDDMYEHLVFDGFTHATMAAVQPALRDRTLTISGVSKTYAMTGWRVGFAAGPRPLIKAMTTMQGHATAGVSGINQAAAAAALDGPQDSVAVQADAYRRRRDLVVDALNQAPGVQCHRPEGAFYVYPNIAGCLGRTTPAGARIGHGRGFRARPAGGAPRGAGPRRRVRHEPLPADQLRDRRRVPGRGVPPHPGVLRRPAMIPAITRAPRQSGAPPSRPREREKPCRQPELLPA